MQEDIWALTFSSWSFYSTALRQLDSVQQQTLFTSWCLCNLCERTNKNYLPELERSFKLSFMLDTSWVNDRCSWQRTYIRWKNMLIELATIWGQTTSWSTLNNKIKSSHMFRCTQHFQNEQWWRWTCTVIKSQYFAFILLLYTSTRSMDTNQGRKKTNVDIVILRLS